jgi:lactate dehydrogenase-like 2-hydroxyacid dehydrogenase
VIEIWGDKEVMMKPSVFVTRALPGAALGTAGQACDIEVWAEEIPPSRDQLLEKAANRDGLITLLTDPVDEAVLEAAGPRLKVVSNYAVGVDNVDVAACTSRGIPVGHTPSVLTETTADLAFALLMAGARRLVEGAYLCRAGRFLSWSPSMLLGWDVHGATLGILGMGRIGRAVARRARGFDMEVIFSGGSHSEESEIEGPRQVTFEELIRRSDFLSLHVPATPKTRHIIDGRVFAVMKENAVLINTARGAVVDQEALVRALRNGEIAYAALDVTDPEPLPNDHELYRLSNCLIVPHLGSASSATRAKMADMAVANLLAGLKGEPLPNCVNPEAKRRQTAE